MNPVDPAIQRHRSMRWMGIPLFAVGLLGLLSALGMAAVADGAWSAALLYLGATGLSLGTFGTHNDTALALMARHQDALTGEARAELNEELARDTADTLSLKATPKTAWGISVVAVMFHCAALARMLL